MVLRFRSMIAVLLLAAVAMLAVPATAHEKHNQNQAAAQATQNGAGAIADHQANPAAADGHDMDMGEGPPPGFGTRLLSFAGRMHPFAVHFPIALFPISWLALLFARRRGDRVDLIRAFIVVAGAAAVAAAALGWLNGGIQLVDSDPIQRVHRWLGTGLAVIGAGLATWAWRRPDSVNSRAMAWALGLVTVVLLAQGWLGGALTHGVEHMMF